MEPDFSRMLAQVVNTEYAMSMGIEKKFEFVDQVSKIDNPSQLNTLPPWVSEFIVNAMNEIAAKKASAPSPMPA